MHVNKSKVLRCGNVEKYVDIVLTLSLSLSPSKNEIIYCIHKIMVRSIPPPLPRNTITQGRIEVLLSGKGDDTSAPFPALL